MSAFEHKTIEANGIRFHVVVGGRGPLLLLLHGWPECAATWKHLMGPFADAGFTVAAPDLRGFGQSDKPAKVSDYRMSVLVEDVAGLVRALGFEKAHVVAHDWGGAIAWAIAQDKPELLERLVIMNAPHPLVFRKRLLTVEQLAASYYIFLFQVPFLPEKKLAADNFKVLDNIFKYQPKRAGAVTPDDVAEYKKGLREPGGLTATLNYYRAAARYGLGKNLSKMITVPTLVLWGMDDVALPPGNLEGMEQYVSSLRVVRVPSCSHWVQHDAPDVVTGEAIAFLSGASPA